MQIISGYFFKRIFKINLYVRVRMMIILKFVLDIADFVIQYYISTM